MTREEAICELSVIWERLSHPEDCENGCYSFRDGDYLEALDMAIEALQIDVVRCKDCRWWNEDDFPRAFPEKKTSACECPNIYGANFSRYTQEDEFCSRGERKGGNDDNA